jgi:hypothetical protein
VRETALAETMSLTEAAERTGYSAEHIGRLVRRGRLPNAGRKNAPRVRLGDLTLEVKPKLAENQRDCMIRFPTLGAFEFGGRGA